MSISAENPFNLTNEFKLVIVIHFHEWLLPSSTVNEFLCLSGDGRDPNQLPQKTCFLHYNSSLENLVTNYRHNALVSRPAQGNGWKYGLEGYGEDGGGGLWAGERWAEE